MFEFRVSIFQGLGFMLSRFVCRIEGFKGLGFKVQGCGSKGLRDLRFNP